MYRVLNECRFGCSAKTQPSTSLAVAANLMERAGRRERREREGKRRQIEKNSERGEQGIEQRETGTSRERTRARIIDKREGKRREERLGITEERERKEE